MLDHDLVLKSDELFLVGDSNTDGSGEPATGLYVRDTRHLSRFRLALNGTPLDRFSARVLGSTTASIVEANGVFDLPDGTTVRPHTIAVEQRVELGDAAQIALRARNFGGRRLSLQLSLRLAADFRDLFDIRGFPRGGGRGRSVEPKPIERGVILAYAALDGAMTETRVAFDRPATVRTVNTGSEAVGEVAVLLPGFDQVTDRSCPPVPPSAVASFAFDLDPGEDWPLTVTVTPVPADGVPISARATLHHGKAPRPARVSTGHPAFDRFYARCRDDLLALQTSFSQGSLPAAGIPWYVAPFGRDSLIIGLQTFHTEPARAATTLRVLASLQGTKVDAEHDEEPGKILHEMRYGEMARLAEIPHTPYFGTVDATPLFVLVFAETVAWTGDEALYRELRPHVERALGWIKRYGDADGDGLVEYRSRAEAGAHIIHQGWKDSHDSLHHTDGRPVAGSIALVEVQGYVYAALARLAEVAAAFGEEDWAAALRRRAEATREAVESRFWMEPEGFYAQALDHDKRPVEAISSNAGHLLFCGLPSAERAAAVAARFFEDDLDSGWGIRTLGSGMPTYNPMSYHNGSVWPHDNSLIAAGLGRYGDAVGVGRIAAALLAAAERDPRSRLPELYCGFARYDGAAVEEPVPYPVSCSPQGWAAGVGPLLVRAFLGLEMDPASGELVVDPALPEWLPGLEIEGLTAHGREGSVSVRREGSSIAVSVEGALRWRRGHGGERARRASKAAV